MTARRLPRYGLGMALRTAYLDVVQRDLAAQLEHALRDRCTALVYGSTARRGRVARAVLSAETTMHRSLRVTRETDRWVISR